MPSSSASNGVATYEALPRPKWQRQFPNRRTSVKRQASIPKLRKDQSTLTQIDFVATPKSTTDLDPISSGDEYEEPRPKKRRRKSKFDEKEEDQPTFTQFMREPSSSARRRKKFGVDEDGFQIWEDYDLEDFMEVVGEKQEDRRKRLCRLQQDNEAEIQLDQYEIPETSQPENKSPKRSTNVAEKKVSFKASSFQTPRKVRFTEVPSSQTPPSTGLSTRSSRCSKDIHISPLKERNTNVQATISQHRSPESQNTSMKMLERVRLRGTRKVRIIDTINRAPVTSLEEALDREDELMPPPKTVAPHLQRVTTVQDSEAEGSDLINSNSPVSPLKRTGTLKRVTTVQDSQFEDDNVLTQQDAGTDRILLMSDDLQEQDYEEDDNEQATFDPANSALDRDALRFGMTQTQARFSHVDDDHTDDGSDDDDLDRVCAPKVTERVTSFPDEPSQLFDDPSEAPAQQAEHKPPTQPENKILHKLIFERPVSRDSAYESGLHSEVEIPSSPPLHPSQVSTVVPTQASQQRPVSREPDPPLSPQHQAIVEACTILSSAQKSGPAFPYTFSSSPLPLPQWNSPKMGRFSDRRENSDGVDAKGSAEPKSLVDYSLPPPPLISSSGRQTPSSSSF